MIKNPPAMQETRVWSLGWEDHLEKGIATPVNTPVFVPGESHGQRSLVGCSSWGCKELGTTQWLTLLLPFTSSLRFSTCTMFLLAIHSTLSSLSCWSYLIWSEIQPQHLLQEVSPDPPSRLSSPSELLSHPYNCRIVSKWLFRHSSPASKCELLDDRQYTLIYFFSFIVTYHGSHIEQA